MRQVIAYLPLLAVVMGSLSFGLAPPGEDALLAWRAWWAGRRFEAAHARSDYGQMLLEGERHYRLTNQDRRFLQAVYEAGMSQLAAPAGEAVLVPQALTALERLNALLPECREPKEWHLLRATILSRIILERFPDGADKRAARELILRSLLEVALHGPKRDRFLALPQAERAEYLQTMLVRLQTPLIAEDG